MAEAQATTAAREVLTGTIKDLDGQIKWTEGNLLNYKSQATSCAAYLDHLRQKRSALQSAVDVHFPKREW